jgi:hypothetical protein
VEGVAEGVLGDCGETELSSDDSVSEGVGGSVSSDGESCGCDGGEGGWDEDGVEGGVSTSGKKLKFGRGR